MSTEYLPEFVALKNEAQNEAQTQAGQEENPGPFLPESTNINPERNGPESDTTDILQLGEEKTALLEVPTEYREDVLEMRSWLAVSVRNGLDGFKEVMQTISHYVEQVPQMRRWLWGSLSGGMQRAVRAALVE